MDAETLAKHQDALLKFMPEVSSHIDSFRSINKRWDGAITAGMIETGRMVDEASRLFGPLIQDMGSTKQKYSEIQSRLIDAIVFEMAKKVVLEITDAAKFAINILKRNLFERTADVGYLATDADIVSFLRGLRDESENGPSAEAIRERLADYQFEYTVYDEILILDTGGRVCANLDPSNTAPHSRDALLQETLSLGRTAGPGQEQYIETFRATDLRPAKKESLVYSQCIKDPDTRDVLGILCLCFDFNDEMEGIFKDLNEGNSQMIVAILDEHGAVMASNDQDALPCGAKMHVDLESPFRVHNLRNRPHLVSTVATDGYQGFYGLTWYGLAMLDVQKAFQQEANEKPEGNKLYPQNHSGNLAGIKMESDDLLADMKLDSINGQVKAAKFEADGFVEVLRFVNMIGNQIDGLFSTAISNLQSTVANSLFNDVQFRAFQGNNIADRNLYERANDVCWWALTPLFRALLAKHESEGLDVVETQALSANLQYINNLYTPYLRLLLADAKGVVVATSLPPSELEEKFVMPDMPSGHDFVGMDLDKGLVSKALSLQNSKDYCVSTFTPTPLYGGRPTYIYSTAVRHPEDDSHVVGVIQIVFDSEPQFEAMLLDSLPKDEKKAPLAGSFGVFTDRDRRVIASTSPNIPVGEVLGVDGAYFKDAKGERRSAVVSLNGDVYAMGVQVSKGYREYKRRDNYDNDVVCAIFAPMGSV